MPQEKTYTLNIDDLKEIIHYFKDERVTEKKIESFLTIKKSKLIGQK